MERTRYVRLTLDRAEQLRALAGQMQEERVQRLLTDIVAEYERSEVACMHARFLRAGSGRRCSDCGAWI
jgi:hypothetical protein